jgi:iron complex outermembrane receptor protein
VSKLQRVEVTGSLIKSSDKIGFNQVQTVTAKDIQQSGYTTVSDFLRGTSANSASSWSESTSNSFAPGGAGIALRGLSQKYTLVLVDGVRVANYGFAVNATDSFFDLNTIPLNMIERIEIVKTGAVSQYGSDAVAGVVNIITKKNFKGLEVDGSYGMSTHADNGAKKLSVLGGFGDLNSQRFNITGALSYFKEDEVTAVDRDMTRTQDFRNYGGGLLNWRQDAWYPGTGHGTTALTPCVAGSTVVARSDISPGASGTTCAFNPASGSSLIPSSRRLNAKVHGIFKFTDDVQAYADLWESRNQTWNHQNYAGVSSTTTAYNPLTGGVASISNLVPAGSPYNPFGEATGLRYVFQGAPEEIKTTSNFFRAATGLKGSFTTPKFGD